MNKYEYAVPEELEEIFGYLEAPNSMIKAGGIDILDLMKEELIAPQRLVNIRHLKALDFLAVDDTGLIIGPNVTLHTLATHEKLHGNLKALAQAAAEAATPQIRNVATLGGNLCQRPRCWYYRSTDFNCSRKGGDTCFALDGENQYHAIFDTSQGCVIVHPSAIAVALMALDARLVIKDSKSSKEIKLEDFFISPSQDITRENILSKGQLVTKIIIPKEQMNYLSYYHKQKEKQAFDWPIADVAVALKLSGQKCTDARVVLGSAAPIPWRVPEAENVLKNSTLTKTLIRQAAEVALNDAEPLEKNAYKVKLFKTIIFRSICYAAGLNPLV